MHIQKGDLVRVREDLKYGMGVCKEQLEDAGKVFEVEFEIGYGLLLKGNDFAWMPQDLELVKKGVNQMFEYGYVIGSIVTTLGLYSWAKFKLLSERKEQEEDE